MHWLIARSGARQLCLVTLACLLPLASLAGGEPLCDGDTEALSDIHAAQACNEQAMALHTRGEYAQAAALYDHLLPAVAAYFGDDSNEVAHVLASLADTMAARQQYARAEDVYVRALAIYEAREETLAQAGVLNGLAAALYMRRQYGKAEPLFRRALGLLEAERGDAHADLLPVLENLAALYQTLHRDRQALDYRRRAEALREHGGQGRQ